MCFIAANQKYIKSVFNAILALFSHEALNWKEGWSPCPSDLAQAAYHPDWRQEGNEITTALKSPFNLQTLREKNILSHVKSVEIFEIEGTHA